MNALPAPVGPQNRPQRYRHVPALSRLVDELIGLSEDLSAKGDTPNAQRLDHARIIVADVALGVSPAERSGGIV